VYFLTGGKVTTTGEEILRYVEYLIENVPNCRSWFLEYTTFQGVWCFDSNVSPLGDSCFFIPYARCVGNDKNFHLLRAIDIVVKRCNMTIPNINEITFRIHLDKLKGEQK
jgi:hypothetical protein